MTTLRSTGPAHGPAAESFADSQAEAPARDLRTRVVNWFVPVLPEARIAILRSVLYLFVLVDINFLVADPPALAQHPDLYQPLFVAELLHLPYPSPTLITVLYVCTWVGCLLGIVNRLPRIAGWTVALSFSWWVSIGMSFGKVDHDHAALVVAVWLLPTVGVVTHRWRSALSSAAAGWVLRCIQITVVATYFLSAFTKIKNGHGDISAWPDSAILTWAIVRRPHALGLALLPHPQLLHVMQWMSILAELSSPIVLWLRGRALLAGALFWMGFHLFTLALLGIHFAPTVICWLAFAPLERLGPWWRRVRARRGERSVARPPTRRPPARRPPA